jgi:ferric-dicitrate binding protein FerR (iron transport regulator)
MTSPRLSVGDRIKLLSMPDDPDPIPAGSLGTIVAVTTGPLAQIEVRWDDSARSLALIPGVDRFEVVERVARPIPTPAADSAICPSHHRTTIYNEEHATAVPPRVYDGIVAVAQMNSGYLYNRLAFARIARWAGFPEAAAWIEDNTHRAAWENGVQYGFKEAEKAEEQR